MPYPTHVPSFQILVTPSCYSHCTPILKVQLKCCLLQEAIPDLYHTSESFSPSSAPLFIMQLLKLYFVSEKCRSLETAMIYAMFEHLEENPNGMHLYLAIHPENYVAVHL